MMKPSNKFLNCAIAATFLIGNLICLCTRLAASENKLVSPHIEMPSCCGDHVYTVRSPAHHGADSQCPHCNEKEKIAVSNGPSIDTTKIPLHLPPLRFESLMTAAPASFNASTSLFFGLAPPPLLRMKCVMQV